MSMDKNIEGIKNEIMNHKFCKLVIEELILFGSYINPKRSKDIDLVCVVKDDTDLYLLMKTISTIMSIYSRKIGMLVTCFPIHNSQFKKVSSQFIQNVKKNGRKL